jgi:hypothetical protein
MAHMHQSPSPAVRLHVGDALFDWMVERWLYRDVNEAGLRRLIVDQRMCATAVDCGYCGGTNASVSSNTLACGYVMGMLIHK